eukprot:gene25573-33387_t
MTEIILRLDAKGRLNLGDLANNVSSYRIKQEESVHSPVQALSDIFKAVDRGNTSVVRTYLNAHGGPNLVDDKGRSLLARAATRGYVEITEMLLGAGADFDQADPDGVTPLIHASAQGHVSIIERMTALRASSSSRVRDKNNDERPPEQITELLEEHAEIVGLLAKAGADVNLRSHEQKTALWLSSSRGLTPIVATLLRYNASVDLFDAHEITPLFISCYYGYSDVVTLLVQHGAAVNRKRDNGINPLIAASFGGFEDIVRYLITQGADHPYRAPDELGGGTAYHYALQQNHQTIAQFLYQLTDDYKSREKDRVWAAQLAQLEEDRAWVEFLYKKVESMEIKEDALLNKVKSIEHIEKHHASELDSIKRIHESIYHNQYGSPVNLEQTVHEMRQKVDQLEQDKNVSFEHLSSLQRQYEVLGREYDQKIYVEQQKQMLKQNQRLKVFYETVDRTLNQLFLAYKVLDTGMVQRTGGKLSTLAGGINLLGSTVSLPFASLVTSTLAYGITKIEDRAATRQIRFIAKLIQNITTLDEETELAARQLTSVYEDQLQHLTPKGSETLAQCGVLRFIEYLRAEQVNDETGLAPQFVYSIATFKSHQGRIPWTHKTIETAHTKGPTWTDKEIFQKSGIKTEKRQLFIRPEKSEHHMYGFRKGTENDVETL